MNFGRLFPTLGEKRWANVNFDSEARSFCTTRGITVGPKTRSPFLNPDLSQELVTECARKNDVDFTYGGYLEDRGFLWSGTYMEKGEQFLHLGIDYNVPAGTIVCSPVEAEVHTIDDDTPEDCGWGPRLILLIREPENSGRAIILGHLRNISVRVSQKVRRGDVLSEVGAPPVNGNWFPHLHVQSVDAELFQRFKRNNEIQKIDGYGFRGDRAVMNANYPNPEFLLRD